MEPIRQVQKKYCSRAMVGVIVTGLLLIVVGYKPEAKGLVLGCLFSIVNFVLIGETLPMRMGKTRRGAFIVSLASISFRFFLMAIPLIVAVKSDQFNVFAVIPGLLMVQFVILIDHFSAALPSRRTHRVKGRV